MEVGFGPLLLLRRIREALLDPIWVITSGVCCYLKTNEFESKYEVLKMEKSTQALTRVEYGIEGSYWVKKLDSVEIGGERSSRD